MQDRATAEALARDKGATAEALRQDREAPVQQQHGAGVPIVQKQVSEKLEKPPPGFDPYVMNDGRGVHDTRTQIVNNPECCGVNMACCVVS